MARRRHLVVFLRVPQRGAAKRRLARGIGPEAAFSFYRTTSRELIRRLGRDRRWTTTLALTPDRLARRARVWGQGLPPLRRLGQGRGDLGARMARVFTTLPPGPVVLIGADIPAVTPELIAAAFARLETREAVFGPARDGGSWLVGLARKRIAPAALAPALFRGVRWSGAHALADTRSNLRVGLEAGALPVLEDVDDLRAWARWRGETGS